MIAIIIQSRFTSTRLPGKALLPIGGLPIVVLAALRAANRGANVCVATSTAESDDLLATTVEKHGIKVVRGPLDDVLQRYVLAAEGLPDTATVIRLTADNVFPDGTFLQEFARAYEKYEGKYLSSDSIFPPLPYGVIAEAFPVSALREANRKTSSAYDREHVTPWIAYHYSADNTPPFDSRQARIRLRATIDNQDDYERVAAVFAGIDDPVAVLWKDLCGRLAAAVGVQSPSRYVAGEWISELTLGTAQLGLADYGRANRTGLPSHPAAVELAREAVARGVDSFDTARAYGTAEHVIGDAIKPFGGRIRVITKLDPMDDLGPDASRADARHRVDASISHSCRELRVDSLPVLLLHRWAHRTCCQGAIWERLLELRAEGTIGCLGASVTSTVEAREALQDPEIKAVQLPFNILDHRLKSAGIDRLALQRPDVVVYARSVFLQGILAAPAAVWPRVPGVDPGKLLSQFEELAKRAGRVDTVDLFLAFVRAQSWINSLVIGVETTGQLNHLIQRLQSPVPSEAEADCWSQSLPALPEALLDPSLWPSISVPHE